MRGIRRSAIIAACLLPAATALAQQCDYLIITNDSLASSFQPLANWRASHNGFATQVKTVSSILSTYAGYDDAEKIRNCIIDYRNNRGTSYVLLGGDAEHAPKTNVGYTYDPIVPARYVDASYIDEDTGQRWVQNVPCDLYYANTTGNWDSNGNHKYGEAGEGDMHANVAVGRLPVRNATNVSNYVNKLISYESQPRNTARDQRFMLVGSQAFVGYSGSSRPGDTTNDGHLGFQQHDPVSDAEIWARRLFRDSVQANGWTYVPQIFTDTITSWDGGGAAGSYALTSANLKSKLNQGAQFVFEDSHGYSLGWMMEGSGAFSTSDGKTMTGLTSVVYSIACDAANYTYYEDPSGNWESCLSEAMLRNASGGALAYIGTAGLSIGSLQPAPNNPASTGGACFDMAREFYRQILADDVYATGQAFANMHGVFAAGSTTDSDLRFMQMAISFQGDPALRAIVGPTEWMPYGSANDGNWSSAGHWTIAPPSGAGTTARFAIQVTADTTVTLDSGRTVGVLIFDNATRRYTIAGTATLSLEATGGATVTVVASPAAGHQVTAPMSLASDTTIDVAGSAALSMTGGLSNTAGKTISKTGLGSLTIGGTQVHGTGAGLSVAGGTVLLASDGGVPASAGASASANLAVSVTSGQLKLLADQTLKSMTAGVVGGIDLAGRQARIYTLADEAAINTAVAAGRIIDSTAACQPSSAIGITDGRPDLHGDPSVLIRLTCAGDANVDCVTNFTDLLILSQNYGLGGRLYDEGDFSRDGTVNFTDLLVLSQNYNASFASADASAVPEPSWLSLAAIAAMALLRRRRAGGSI